MQVEFWPWRAKTRDISIEKGEFERKFGLELPNIAGLLGEYDFGGFVYEKTQRRETLRFYGARR